MLIKMWRSRQDLVQADAAEQQVIDDDELEAIREVESQWEAGVDVDMNPRRPLERPSRRGRRKLFSFVRPYNYLPCFEEGRAKSLREFLQGGGTGHHLVALRQALGSWTPQTPSGRE